MIEDQDYLPPYQTHLQKPQKLQLPEFLIHWKTLQPSFLSVLKYTLTKVSVIYMTQNGALSLVLIRRDTVLSLVEIIVLLYYTIYCIVYSIL